MKQGTIFLLSFLLMVLSSCEKESLWEGNVDANGGTKLTLPSKDGKLLEEIPNTVEPSPNLDDETVEYSCSDFPELTGTEDLPFLIGVYTHPDLGITFVCHPNICYDEPTTPLSYNWFVVQNYQANVAQVITNEYNFDTPTINLAGGDNLLSYNIFLTVYYNKGNIGETANFEFDIQSDNPAQFLDCNSNLDASSNIVTYMNPNMIGEGAVLAGFIFPNKTDPTGGE